MPKIRAFIAFLPIIFFLACSGTLEEADQVESEPVRSAESEAAETDLILTTKLNSSKSIFPGQKIEISPSLLNSSNTKSYRVIKPSDGSSDGRREPHVFFSVDYQANEGQWIEAPRRVIYGCGVYSEDWARDYYDLEPGGTLALNKWITRANRRYEFQKPGIYRVQFHYKYRGGTYGINHENGKRYGKDNLPKEVRDIPPFHVISDPIEIVVERPLEVQLKTNLQHVSGSKISLSDMFDLTLLNTSNEPIEVVTNWGLSFEIQGRGSRPAIDMNQTKSISKKTIESGDSVALLGKKDGFNGIWKYPILKSMKVRAIYKAITLEDSATIKSNWVVINSGDN